VATFEVNNAVKSIELMLYGSISPVLVITINDGTQSAQKVRFELYGTDREQIVALFRSFVEDMDPQSDGSSSCAFAKYREGSL
jgi:hypothetical protein